LCFLWYWCDNFTVSQWLQQENFKKSYHYLSELTTSHHLNDKVSLYYSTYFLTASCYSAIRNR
jgi:hypothetical protein